MANQEQNSDRPRRGGGSAGADQGGGRPRPPTLDAPSRSSQTSVRRDQGSRHARIPASVIPRLAGLSKRAVIVYLALAAHADKNGDGYPSREALADATGYTSGGVTNAMAELVREGLVERRQVGARRWTFHLLALPPGESGSTTGVEAGSTTGVEAKKQPNRTESLDPDGSNRTTPSGDGETSTIAPMPSASLPVPHQLGLDGSEVEAPPMDWPNEVRRAYFAAWRDAHGTTPPGAHVSRMMGKVREVQTAVGRYGSEDEWPAWVEAAAAAARAGRWDIVQHYPAVRTRRRSKVADALDLARRLDERGA